MTEKKYPEAIYETRDGLTMTLKQRNGSSGKARRSAYDLGYEDGKQAQGDLTGWSNLTEAIKAGGRIDWEKLDGVEAKCVHPELGTLTHRLEHDEICSINKPGGWYVSESTGVWKQAIYDSWMGFQGWSLWGKGDLPLRKLTADDLEPGTCFRARYQKGVSTFTYNRAQVLQAPGGTYVFCFDRQFAHISASYDPADVEVLEVYGVGTFKKLEGDA